MSRCKGVYCLTTKYTVCLSVLPKTPNSSKNTYRGKYEHRFEKPALPRASSRLGAATHKNRVLHPCNANMFSDVTLGR